MALALADVPRPDPADVFRLPEIAPGVVPGHRGGPLAMDSACGGGVDPSVYQWAGRGVLSEGLGFLGYPYLAELTQRPEYRRPAEIIANEMTRKWMRVVAVGSEDLGEKIERIEAELVRIGAQKAFTEAAEFEGFFGRSHIYVDLGVPDDDQAELKTPLVIRQEKIRIGSLKGLRVIDPTWTYPSQYNSINPLVSDFYTPVSWFVMAKEVHASRLLTFISRPVPTLLKPAYAFGGLSLVQMMKPYVDNWIRTRSSVSDLVHNFSVSVLKTQMSNLLAADDSSLANRATLFTRTRDNRGLMMLDKDTEEFVNVSTPLSGLHELQSQAQEQMAAVTGIPLVKLLGITPSGLNASSDGEMRCFYDWVASLQSRLFEPGLKRLIDIIQLSLFGEIDPGIGIKWEPLWTLDEAAAATARKTEADTDTVYIEAGVLDPHEVRERIARAENSPYAGIDLDEMPEPGPEDEGGLIPDSSEAAQNIADV